MATCLAVIKRAMRMLGTLPSGREPDASEASDGLEALLAMYQDLILQGSLGKISPVLVSANYIAGENERIANPTGTAVVITLPETITPNSYDTYDPCCIWDGCQSTERAPRDRSVVVIAGDTPQSYIYDAATATWIDLVALSLTAYAPMSNTLGEGLSARLAVTLSAEFGPQVPPVVALAAGRFMSAITGRHDIAREPVRTSYF